jgi:hypothetical protein
MKTQLIRLADVAFIGPFMLYASMRPKLTDSEKMILAGLGIATILYNGINYLKYETKKTA